jgi:hypothetical protein
MYRNSLLCALGCFHEGYAGLHLNVLSNQNFLLKGVRPATSAAAGTAAKRTLSSSEMRKQIIEVDVGAEASLAATKSTTEAGEWTAGAKGMTSSRGGVTILVES